MLLLGKINVANDKTPLDAYLCRIMPLCCKFGNAKFEGVIETGFLVMKRRFVGGMMRGKCGGWLVRDMSLKKQARRLKKNEERVLFCFASSLLGEPTCCWWCRVVVYVEDYRQPVRTRTIRTIAVLRH